MDTTESPRFLSVVPCYLRRSLNRYYWLVEPNFFFYLTTSGLEQIETKKLTIYGRTLKTDFTIIQRKYDVESRSSVYEGSQNFVSVRPRLFVIDKITACK